MTATKEERLKVAKAELAEALRAWRKANRAYFKADRAWLKARRKVRAIEEEL